jgi:hypothetical protein
MAIDWTHIHRKFKGFWVALDDDEKTVLGSGKTAKEALNKAQEKGHEAPILTHMPSTLINYIGGNA